jgi:group I intron endonuclease
LANEKLYVGSAARSFKSRFAQHKHLLKTDKHFNRHLHNAWNKYGEENFVFAPIEYVAPEKCVEREQYWINELKPSLNIAPIAGSCRGIKRSEEYKQKLSIINSRLETRTKIGAAHKGKIVSLETRQKQSNAHKGKKYTLEQLEEIKTRYSRFPEIRGKMSRAKKGKNLSPTHKEKIKIALNSPETRERMSRAQTGKKHTPEHIAKAVAANTGKKRSEEFKARLSAMMTGAKNPLSKPILCIELNKTFESTNLAEKFLRETINPKAINSNISACANGRYKSAYGFHWKYI